MKKRVLYIIHGWTYTVAPWEKTIALLERQGIKVEMLNVPGLTTSSQKVWTIEDYVRWADRQIPDGAVALGHSNGGRILLNLCSENPAKLQHLILLDAAGVYEASTKRDTARSLSKKLGFLKKIPGLAKLWHKLVGASDYARAPENMKRTLSNMLDSDKKLDLTKVTTPTSILWGAEDTVTPPRQAEAMHEKIPGSTLEIYPHWNHAPYIAHPGDLAKAIYRAYRKPPVVAPVTAPEVTHAATVSASMAMKKAAEPTVPDTKKISASMAMKKASGPAGDDVSSISAALALPSKDKKAAQDAVLSSLAGVEFEKAEPEIPHQVIATSSVPKVGMVERARRKMGRQPKVKTASKPSRKSPKSPKVPRVAKKSQKGKQR